MAIDDVDFCGGKPRLKLGGLMPACTRAVNVTAGPDGDGLMCILRLPRDEPAKVHQSQLLEHIAPEARLISLVLLLQYLLSFLHSQARLESRAGVLYRTAVQGQVRRDLC